MMIEQRPQILRYHARHVQVRHFLCTQPERISMDKGRSSLEADVRQGIFAERFSQDFLGVLW